MVEEEDDMQAGEGTAATERELHCDDDDEMRAKGVAAAVSDTSLVVLGSITSVEELRKKKGHYLLGIPCCGSKTLHVVTDRPAVVGEFATIALEGARLRDGQLVRCMKIAGEWSEGVLLSLGAAPESSQGASAVDSVERPDVCADPSNAKGVILSFGAILECSQEPSAVDSVKCPDAYGVPSNAKVGKALAPVGSTPDLRHVTGNAAKASHGSGRKVISHIVNDAGGWGKGFVMAISKEWGKSVRRAYFEWHRDRPRSGFRLGAVQVVAASPRIDIVNMIGQCGMLTGSQGAPIRYAALEEALGTMARHAAAVGASVHMPRIGCGLAGGEWARIEPLIAAISAAHSLTVYIYSY